jgi:tetratricopeptide (TPR) repeat protein
MSRRRSRGFAVERRRIAVAIALLVVLAGCAKKPATAPAPAGAPRFADFVFPAAGPDMAGAAVLTQHRAAWQMLQTGDTKSAERDFAGVLKQVPDFYPAEAGLGYAALARKDGQAALAHFDKVLARNGSYAPALAGRGESLLSLGRVDAAADAFQAALTVDPSLTALRGRAEVLKFRGVQQSIESARKAAEAGKLDEARRGYLDAIAASPQSAFLFRELAMIEQKAGDRPAALAHARQAATLDPADGRALLLIAEVLEGNGEWVKAADAYTAANAVEPSEATAGKIDSMREKAAFDAMPEQYRSIEASPTVTRAQLAALLGIRLGDMLRRAQVKPVVVTDVRTNWAAPWIQSVTRAGVMEPFDNHTFQPNTTVRRGDLAQAVSRVLSLVATANPRLAARWRDPRPKFSDLGPSHLLYPAAARAVSAEVMVPLEGETFQLTRPVTGSEARDAVSKLEALAKK